MTETPLPALPDAATLEAWNRQFRQVADWTNTALLELMQYSKENADFDRHFAVFPGLGLKAGAGQGPVANDNGFDPATIQTPDDLKAWMGHLIVASPNLPDQNLEPGVLALRERAIQWALDRTKEIYLANDNLPKPANSNWTDKVAARPPAQLGSPG